MKDNPKKKFIGTQSQKNLLKLYAKYVNSSKVRTFKSFGLGVIPGERSGIKLKTLEGARSGEPQLELYNCRSSGGVFNLGHRNPKIIKTLKDVNYKGPFNLEMHSDSKVDVSYLKKLKEDMERLIKEGIDK